MPRLAQARSGGVELPVPGCLHLQWPLGDAARWHLLANLSATAALVPEGLPGDVVYTSHASSSAQAPWSVRVHLELT
jgi:hypothetical protein